MFKKIRNFINKNGLVMLILLISLYLFFNIINNNKKMLVLSQKVEKVSEDNDMLKIKIHAQDIKLKIDLYIKTRNADIDYLILGYYGKAYELALSGDLKCYLMEAMGDISCNMYISGYDDGFNKCH